MDDRPKRLADYFAVVGLGDKAELCSEIESPDCTDLPYSTCDPITELAIMHKGDKVPDGFKTINETTNGQSANLNAGNILSGPIFLCFSRKSRSISKHPLPLQPICSISVYYPDRTQPIAEGHEVIEKTIGGAQADLNLFGRIRTYLTFKRGLLYGHTPAITDLAIIGKDQNPPPGFKKLNLNLNKGIGPSLYICYKMAIVKPPSVSYKASILSRYPKTDYEDFPLPDSSPLFCLPLGVCVEHWGNSGQFPLPTFSTFILTNSVGAKMYGSAVTFYEQVNFAHESLPHMRKDLGVRDKDDKAPLYMSKCICMLSRWPFFSAFKVFLSSLYRISLSPGTTLPIERYILNLMSDVPFPSISRPRVMMEIGSEQLIFTLPVKTPLPISISNHWSLVNSLDANNCVTLFTLLLMEQKVILHSSRPSLLTCVGEALTSVLFPFQWQCPYIPMCPLALSVYTQAPMSFIIGIDTRYFDHYEKPDDVCVVDLDCNTISIPNEIKKFIADRPLPLKAQKFLRKELKAIATKLQGMMVDSDLAVELAPLDYAEIESRNSLDQIDINVREVFLRFNGIVFGHYSSCLTARVDSVAESAREAKNLFNQTEFLKKCAPIDHAFYKAVFKTQMFINFVEQRSYSYSMDTTVAFFDECTEKLARDLQAKLIKPLAESQKQPDVTIVAAPPHGLGLERDKKYSYEHGFPVLDDNLFLIPSSDQPTSPNVDDIKKESSSMIAVRSAAEKTKGKQAAEVARENGELWAKTLLAEIYCIWFIHFPGFFKSDWNKMIHLEKAFTVLEKMHEVGAIPNDEVCYRVLMEQCVKLWKPFMAVKVFTEMQKAGVKPNAVTYGIYNRALIDCNCPGSVKSRWRAVVIVIRTCLYLRKKVAPSDVRDKMNMRLVRRNSYDEAIGGIFTVQRHDSQSSNSSSKGNGSPKLVHIKRSRSASISKKVLSQFGRDSSQKRSNSKRNSREQQEPEAEGSTTTKDQQPEAVKDEGYTVKTGSASQEIKSTQKLIPDVPDSSERRNHSRSFSVKRPRNRGFSRAATTVRSNRFDNMMPGSRSSSRMYNFQASSAGPNDLNIDITSCTECNNCQRLVYDEDIMSNWSALDSVYNTKCPYCSHPFVAQLVIQLQHHHRAHPTPETLQQTPKRISKIPEETSPTPPARRKRDRPIRMTKRTSSKSSGESTPSDSPKSSTQGSTNSSPLVNKITKQEAMSSTENSPLVNKVARQEVTSSSGNGPLVNKVTKQEVISDDTTSITVKKDTMKNDSLSATHLDNKQNVSPKLSGNGPIINVTGSFADEIMKQLDTKANISDCHSSTDQQGSEDTGPPSAVVMPTKGEDMPDTASHIAMMKSRGHARTHSAPLVLDEEEPKTVSDKITVTTVDIVTGSSEQGKNKGKDDKENKEDKVAPPIVVHYLGPLVLRKEVESLLIREGLSYLERDDFPVLSPTVFWNLVWYFTRLGLSSYLPRQALFPFSEFIENKQRNLTINLLWDCIPNIHDTDPPLYRLWKDKVAQVPMQVAGPQRQSASQLQSFVAHLQCWDLLPVAEVILSDRRVERNGPRRGLYHDLALFCSYIREGSLDIERFDQEYGNMLQQIPKHLQGLIKKQDQLPSMSSNMCQLFFNTLYVV